MFLTHLHSDDVAGVAEFPWSFAWASSGRSVPLQVWGPRGTRGMVGHLQKAFAFDIRIPRDVDEKFPADGIKANVTDIHEGVVYSASEVKVTAFLVDHSPVDPAFGYRIDYRGHSAVLSGDTKPSDNLVKFSQGADLLIHEVGRWKQDPVFIGPPDEVVPEARGQRAGRAGSSPTITPTARKPDEFLPASAAQARRLLPLQRRPCGHASARQTGVRRTRSIRRRPDDH